MIQALFFAYALAQAPVAEPAPAASAVRKAEPVAEVTPQETQVAASVTVAVTQRDTAADTIVAETQRLGGWFQSRTGEALSLRVPVASFDALVTFVEAQGKPIDKSLTKSDASLELADLRGRLAARESVLEEYYRVLRTAGPDSVVAVENQVVRAVSQIEELRGRIRLLEDQVTVARLDVAFQFRDRRAPTRDGNSSFAWLNSLNVHDVAASMQQETAPHHSRGVTVTKVPEGFSAWRKPGRYRAASPDDVLFRVRTVRHKPSADLKFWKEAVAKRMTGAGYKVLAEGDIQAGTMKGGTIELAAPMGTEDWSYWLAFIPNGRRLVVVEAAGPVTAVEPRKDAILAAAKALTF